MQSNSPHPKLKEATLHRNFFEKPFGLLLTLMVGPPLALLIIVNVANLGQTYRLLGMFLAILAMIPFVLSLVFNVSFFINRRHFKKLKIHYDLLWTLPTEKWVKFWEKNSELEKKHALAVFLIYFTLLFFLAMFFGFIFYLFKSHGDGYLIPAYLFFLLLLLVALVVVPFGMYYRGRALLKRAKRTNVPIYLNSKMIYVNGRIIFLKQVNTDTKVNIVKKPMPHIEIILSNRPIHYQAVLVEKFLAHFMKEEYLRASNVMRIPLPEDKEMVYRIEAILNLKKS